MQIAILGALEVRDATGAPVEISGARLRTLLTRLAVDAGRPVSVAALVDAVWGDQPPAEENNALQTLVSRLRRGLGDPAAIAQSGAGYRLALDAGAVDANRFERLAGEGSAALRLGDTRAAAQLLADALALWRGPALADALEAGDALVPHATRLEDLRLAALLDRIEADLEVGQPARLVAELEALVAEHPLHERLAGQLLRALAATGRPADALRAYERLRARLADELGVDPSSQLQEIHLALLRGDGEPASAPTPRRTNLKAQLTSFVGRDDEVVRIGKSLEQNRLVTLVGPGGAGKTRLANEAGASIVDTAPDGIWLAELASVTSGSDVAQAVLGSLGLREIHLMDRTAKPSVRDALSRLCERLADKRAVVILDNCEHVIDASAALADHLLRECPELRVLTTSREPLGILGEALLSVPPLGQPAPTASAAQALEYPAVRLFADRAAAVRPDFEIDDDTVRTVIDIVRRLDGLPLAIELAAARLRTLPLDEIATRLSDRFRLLTGGSRTAMPRHRTLRAVVEWSWDLLNADERLLAEQLSVFPSGVTVSSATAVRPDAVPAEDVPDLLASLIDKSLLQPVNGGRRLRMLETIREYGAERLAERGELGEVRARHAAHFEAVLAEAEPHLTTAGQLPWFDLLGAERENILAAMRFRGDAGDAGAALRIALALAGYAMMLGDHAEISSWITDALAVPGDGDRDLRVVARALLGINTAAGGGGSDDVSDGLRAMKEIAVELGDIDVSVSPFVAMLRPVIAFFAGDNDLAAKYAQQAIDGDDDWGRAAVRMFMANLAENEGDVATMRFETETALAEFRRLGERWGIASTLRGLAALDTLDGNLDGAEAAYEESLDLMAQLKSTDDEVFLFGRLAELAIRRDDIETARRHIERAQAAADNAPSGMESVYAFAMFSEIEQRVGNVERSREMHDEALSRLETMPREHPMQGHIRSMVLAMSARRSLLDGDLPAAARLVADAYVTAVLTRDLPVIANVGVLVAALAVAVDDPVSAARIAGAAARLRGADDHTSPYVAEVMAELRGRLAADVLPAEYEAGRALARDEAIARLDPALLDMRQARRR